MKYKQEFVMAKKQQRPHQEKGSINSVNSDERTYVYQALDWHQVCLSRGLEM